MQFKKVEAALAYGRVVGVGGLGCAVHAHMPYGHAMQVFDARITRGLAVAKSYSVGRVLDALMLQLPAHEIAVKVKVELDSGNRVSCMQHAACADRSLCICCACRSLLRSFKMRSPSAVRQLWMASWLAVATWRRRWLAVATWRRRWLAVVTLL